MATLKMSSRHGKESMLMKNVLLTENIPIESYDIDVGNYPHLKDLSFPTSGSVDILIGQDNQAALVLLEVRSGNTIFHSYYYGMGTKWHRCTFNFGRCITSNLMLSTVMDEKINILLEAPDDTAYK